LTLRCFEATLPAMLIVLAASVYLNGVNIDGVRNQSFEKCKSARIDENGDVRLECPGYQVEPGQRPAAPAAKTNAPKALTRQYWMVSESEDSAAAQYDVDVSVNGRFVRRIKAGDPQVAVDITRFITAGPNKIRCSAVKHLEGGRKSEDPGRFLKITIGEGKQDGEMVTIDTTLVECKRTAAETSNVNQEFTLEGR
jgi:hypothetical protein